jgi:MFS-type transporter involved in bile tolerance (Atg22 family)
MWSLSIAFSTLVGVTTQNTVWGIWGIIVILAVGLVLLLRVDPKPKVAEVL